MIVVSDTSAICYLILIGEVDLLPSLFGRVIIPPSVHDELTDLGAPDEVQAWFRQQPGGSKFERLSRFLLRLT